MAIALEADPRIAADLFHYREGGAPRASLIVKVTLGLVAYGSSTLGPPEPIRAVGEHDRGDAARSLLLPGERTPPLERCDVIYKGSAYASPRAASRRVRFALYRERRALVDKVADVYGPYDAAGAPTPFDRLPITYELALGGPHMVENPVGSRRPNVVDARDAGVPFAIGPVAPGWPLRRRHLGGLPPEILDALVPAFPAAVKSAAFAAAPLDQRVELLGGGEWLLLEGLTPLAERVQTELRIPSGRVEMVTRREGRVHRDHLALQWDGLVVDGDRSLAFALFRTHVPIPASLGGIVIVSLADRPHTIPDAPAIARLDALERSGLPEPDAPAIAPPTPSVRAPVGEETRAVPEGAALDPALPFARNVGEETMTVDAAIQRGPAIPFPLAPSAPPSRAPARLDDLRGPPLAIPASSSQEETLSLRSMPAVLPPAALDDEAPDAGPSSEEMDRLVAEQYPLVHDEIDDLDPESEASTAALLRSAGATPEEIEDALAAMRFDP